MQVTKLMALSAKTAPKGVGHDYIEIVILDPVQCDHLGKNMIDWGERTNDPGFVRDGNNLCNSMACLLIGLRDHPGLGLNCGACDHACGQFPTKKGEPFVGPQCEIRVLDMGIALGSAAKTASIHNVDNRIMYRAGAQAMRDGIIKANFVHAIPLNASSKSPYYDR